MNTTTENVSPLLALQPGEVTLAQLRAIQGGGLQLSMAASAYADMRAAQAADRAPMEQPTPVTRDIMAWPFSVAVTWRPSVE